MKRGGLVLLDVENNEILAMVSKPSIQQNDKSTYEQALENQMVTPHFPGSIFKTVIAAAAIDQKLLQPNRMFNCDTDLYGEDIPEVMMGKLNFKESFARSCNRTFAELGNELMQLDKSVMETYLKALGGSGDVGWTGPYFMH